MKLLQEQVSRYGAENSIDTTLLALILGSENIANELLERFGDFKNISLTSIHSLSSIKGMTKLRISKLKALFEIAKRFDTQTIKPGIQLQGSKQVFFYFRKKLQDLNKEHFYIIMLNSKHKVIREELISIGGLNLAIVEPRSVFTNAIKECAESILLLHNHPSHCVLPSKEDIALTKRLVEVGKLVGIEVLDHIIIGDNSYTSFLEEKLF